ncbi:MAG: hypothetical protein OXH15_16805 [Gammaproteobacteria bacterium]|nr:hypothetical protein [Gammaproteobacteria bacterium]
MNTSGTIAAYVERLRRRSTWLARIQLASLGVLAAVLTTVVFAVVAAYVVPSQGAVVAARVALYALIAATLIACVRLSVGALRAVRRAERRVPVFDGRLRTWFDASRRMPPPALLGQLGAEAADVAKAHPPHRAFPARLVAAPAALAVVALGLLAWFQTAAPQHMRLPAERLLLGDAFADTRPRIIVEPGDTVVSRGTDILLRAEARGFATDALRLHATFAGADWELADMLPGARSLHEFVLVAVTEPVDYFVSAGSVRSDRFRIEVADLPVVDAVDVVLAYPAWTRLEAHRQDHGDVAGVRGTQVAVTVGATAPMADAKLVMDDRAVALDATNAATFAIEDDGTWHVAATHRGELVRISESFLIEALEDLPPEVEFAFPGRDRSASAIEEVALRFRARDDFGVEALDLHYAVNGGAWAVASAAVEAGERDALSSHLLSFENLEAGDGRAIRPGDVVSFFAEARDHGHSTRSALYFVDVRPFDKRYRQRADGGGGGGGAGGGSGGLELSARQRDITAATWNLIRERDAGTRAGTDLDDQIDVLGILQTTLKDQVDTMIVRSEGRRLSFDEEVGVFVEELKAASVAMETAAATLAARNLDGAVAPEQRALQHLLTAEASLRDIDVTLTRSDSPGDAVSRSLSELADLELDPTRNRYETADTPRFGPAEEADDEDEWERLTELARRHEELARRRERGETQEEPLSRWQLERLKRELETLRERLADAESGESPANRTGQASGGAEIANAIARLERAMDDSNPDQREAEAEAFRQGAAALRGSAERLRQRGVDDLAGRLRKAEEEAGDLLSDHRRIGERLEELQQELLRATRAGERRRYRDYGFEREAQTKRRMQDDLTRIAADLADIRQRLERVPESGEAVARQIDRALDELAESRINERLGLGAEYFEMGNPLFVIAQETRIGGALEDLRERLDRAAERMEGARAGSGASPTVDDLQRLRRRLQDIGVGGPLRDLEDVASAARRLGRQLQDGVMDLEAMRARYRGLGASEDNRERLYRLTLDELDRLEVALGKVEAGSVRATPPRDIGYESAAVARYFRQLSCDDC